MALGNILGSNVFNLGIVFWADLAYRPSGILDSMEPAVAVTAGLGLILALLIALALKLKRPGSGREAVMINIIIVLVYLLGMRWIFRLSSAAG